MKTHSLSLRSLLANVVFISTTLITSTLFSQPSQAQSITFYCGTSNGKPTTMASTPRGNIPVVHWVSPHFTGAGYNPQTRCEEVSSRFQTYYNNGTLSYLTTGIMNGQPVVCVTSTNGGGCSGLLFTLKRGQNASRTLQQLFEVRTGAGGPLYESTTGGSGHISNQNGQVFVDVNQYLNSATAEAGNTPTQPTLTPTPNNNPSTPQPTQPGGAIW
ncbi:MAG: COP23 domain-containing protein [Oscillatoria sp. PMC 1068.18]|nr:COP23 domain-containing protein [Oscillatoria sp. PMC 1076.18]MEC4987998.1 COP23 domain-containing protein [Oscillatoria sp. PMC 1068.18]